MDDIQIHKIKVKKAKRKQEACGWCLGWRGDACRGGSVCDKLAILHTVSPKGTSVKASLSPSPVRQAPFVLGFLEPHFSAWSHGKRTPQWKGGENPCVCAGDAGSAHSFLHQSGQQRRVWTRGPRF